MKKTNATTIEADIPKALNLEKHFHQFRILYILSLAGWMDGTPTSGKGNQTARQRDRKKTTSGMSYNNNNRRSIGQQWSQPNRSIDRSAIQSCIHPQHRIMCNKAAELVKVTEDHNF